MAAEQLILVDAHDRELGVGGKLQVHLEGALHTPRGRPAPTGDAQRGAHGGRVQVKGVWR